MLGPMAHQPNILILMCDQLRGDVLDPGHPCKTPNLDRLAARGVRITRAYAPNAICSPSRASMMTGLLPHNHGVLTVTHCVDEDQSCLRTEHPHFAQRLEAAGYRTGYFGKWHVERSHDLARFGWQVQCEEGGDKLRAYQQAAGKPDEDPWVMRYEMDTIPGWPNGLIYGVTRAPIEQRRLGVITTAASDYLDEALAGDGPWCCMVSTPEPHDPYVCGEQVYKQYDVDAIELPENMHDDLSDKPNLYRKAARAYANMTDEHHRRARACYWASITEIDQQFGKLLDKLEAAGQRDNTLVILTSDHGEILGEHGMYCKNVGGWQSVYHIPMVAAGPGVETGQTAEARVGLHDLCPTLCDLAGAEPIDVADSRSFAGLLRDPAGRATAYQTGFAEYAGTRFGAAQRIAWDGDMKYCMNAFDFDELYDLANDPLEMTNRIDDPACAEQAERLIKIIWQRIRETGDHTIESNQYPGLRGLTAPGPRILDE